MQIRDLKKNISKNDLIYPSGNLRPSKTGTTAAIHDADGLKSCCIGVYSGQEPHEHLLDQRNVIRDFKLKQNPSKPLIPGEAMDWTNGSSTFTHNSGSSLLSVVFYLINTGGPSNRLVEPHNILSAKMCKGYATQVHDLAVGTKRGCTN